MSAKSRILAVDDNPTNLLILEDLLEESYELQTAKDGNDALLVAPSFLPDVVLLDVMMPGLDGYEVCRRMKSKLALKHGRVIMVSAKTELADRLAGYDAGADDYVTKPFDGDELCVKIEFAIRTKRLEEMCGVTGEVLALTSELRDTEIVRDHARFRAYCSVLATELRSNTLAGEIDDQFLDDLRHACVLRDVGHLATPKQILEKSGSFATEERTAFQQHTLIGFSLLNRLAKDYPEVSLFRMAADVARSHHERFDGLGYPDRLLGTQIPLAARIVAMAEFFDTSLQRHGPLVRLAQCRAYDQLFNGHAGEFDPAVVIAFQSRYDELIDLSEQPDDLVAC